ncbi:hypothetical protein BDQ17DRAFT_1334239 [Cyathus striatus]|nr:hypothetical protein BDQ17DRAFT_1334239 [Cyathus striatus]
MARKTRRTRTLANSALETIFPVNARELTEPQHTDTVPLLEGSVTTELNTEFTSAEEPLQLSNSAQPHVPNVNDGTLHEAVDIDNPFISSIAQPVVTNPCTPPRSHFTLHTPGSAESFPSPDYASSTSDHESQHPEIRNVCSTRSPSGNKSGNRAKDVWGFFEESGGFNYCAFCKHVKKVTRYACKTGTTVLRKHLCDAHGDVWNRTEHHP